MGKLFSITALKLKLVAKDKSSIIWMFVAPIIFITVIIYGFNKGDSNRIKVAVVDEASSQYTTEFLQLMEKDDYDFYDASLTEARSDIISGKIPAAIVLPKEFDQIILEQSMDKVKVLKLQDSQTSISIMNNIELTIKELQIKYTAKDAVTNLMDEYQIAYDDSKETEILKNYDEIRAEDKIKLTSPKVNEDNKDSVYDTMTYSALGIMVIFIMFCIMNNSSGILEEKINGTWRRLLTTKVNSAQILSGNLLAIFLLGVVQSAILVLFSKYAFHIDWGKSVLGIVGIFGAFVFSITGIAMIVGVLVGSKKQLNGLVALIVMPTSLLAGCMWSRDIMSDMLIKLSDFFPQSYILVGVSDLLLNGKVTTTVMECIGKLMIFGVVFFGIAFLCLLCKRKDQKIV
jgi:ABC-2 type transport system permease protein